MEKIHKTDAEWKALLTPEQYQVTRHGGTECAFTGALWNDHSNGVLHCVCCDLPLFDSNTKFESGTGWPSFFDPAANEAVISREDSTHGMRRVEVLRSEEHTSELQSLMRISYAVFCLKKKISLQLKQTKINIKSH